MARIGVCLETVFTSLPFSQRIEKVAACGFDAVEMWMPGEPGSSKDPAVLKQAAADAGVVITDLVVNAPDSAPIVADELNNFLEGVHKAIAYAKEVGIKMGITCSGNTVDSLTDNQMISNLEKAWGLAAEIAQKEDFVLVVEALNTLVDHAGYYLDSSHKAAQIIRAVNNPNLKLLYDVYHMQIMEGNIIANIEKHIDIIGHFHSAGVPGRHELNRGELDYKQIIAKIDSLGYTGVFGLEYIPHISDSAKSLRSVRAYLDS